jgi:hypothetical protein
MSAQTKVEKWEIAGSFPHMAGDIFLTQTPNGFLPRLAVTLRFRAKDLRLVFERAVGYTWKNDSWVGFSFAADSSEFPRFVAEGPGRQWRFIYPLLEVKDSAWAAQYTMGFGPGRHFVLMSEIGSMEILAAGEISSQWIERGSATEEPHLGDPRLQR